MRKTYKLIEEETPKQEFKIIKVSPNKKDVVFADGTSLSDIYFSGAYENTKGIDEVWEIAKINGVTYYRVFNRNSHIEILCSNKNGGEVFDHPLSYVESKNKLFIVRKKGVPNTLGFPKSDFALVDLDFNVVIDWCDYIVYAFDNLFVVTNDEGDNIFDVSSKTYLFEKYFESIETVSNTKLFNVEQEGGFNLVNDKGEFIFKTKSGTPIWADHMENITLEFEKDNLSDLNKSLDCLIVTDSAGYDSLYIFRDNVPEKVEIWYGDAILGEGSYKLLRDEPGDGALMITTKYEDQYTYINKEGKVQYDKWFSSFDKDTLEAVDCMIITRGKKFNIISIKSMTPLCDDDDWFDDYEYIEDPYGKGNDMLAVRKNGKCNLLDVTKEKDEADITDPLLDTPCDDIMIWENKDRKEKHVICMYDRQPYLYIGHNLFKSEEIYEGRNGLIFIKDTDGKWNFVFVDHWNRKDEPSLELDYKDEATDIYDIDGAYPIIEKDGKYTFIDTEMSRIAFTLYDLEFNHRTNKYEKKNERIRWFDDVESYDENNEFIEFRVKEDGEWKTIDDMGKDVDENEEYK